MKVTRYGAWRSAQRYAQLEQLNTAKPTVFYLGLPEHGNLGDQAIAKATEIYLQEQLPQHQVVRIANDAVLPCIPLLKRGMQPNHLIVMHGGGNQVICGRALKVRRAVVNRLKMADYSACHNGIPLLISKNTRYRRSATRRRPLGTSRPEEQAHSAMQCLHLSVDACTG